MLANLVLPGAALVRANGWRTRALIRLDLPTFDRPTIATSGSRSRGKSPAPTALVTNSATICNPVWLSAVGSGLWVPAIGSQPKIDLGRCMLWSKAWCLEPRVDRSVWTRVSCGLCHIGDNGSGGNARRQRLGQRNLQHLVHRRHHVHVE